MLQTILTEPTSKAFFTSFLEIYTPILYKTNVPIQKNVGKEKNTPKTPKINHHRISLHDKLFLDNL